MASILKKGKVKLDLLTDINMLFMVEKPARGEIFHAILRIISSLKATQLENKINQLGKNKLDVDSLKENYKEFIKTINQY